MIEALQKAAPRFWLCVSKGDGCWLWTGGRGGFGMRYGSFRTANKTYRAHRVAWMLTHGEIPSSVVLCHRCDNPLCVRPEHLFAGTASDNMRDMTQKGRRYVPRGEKHSQAKLCEADVREIRRLVAHGVARRSIAARFGVHHALVGGIVNGRYWSHVH